jgi:peptidoglycan/xylan/chitin deacetylase (PgdA/CDA1 family)
MARNTVARALFFAGLTRPGRGGPLRLSVVTFHRVLPSTLRDAYPYPGLVVTPAELDTLLLYFKEHFDCGTLEMQHARLINGEKSSRPLLALTFDDAQYDNYRYALPVLRRHGVKATFFAPVRAVEEQQLLWHDRLGFAILSLISQGKEGIERAVSLVRDAQIWIDGAEGLVTAAVRGAKRIGSSSRITLTEALVAAAGKSPPPDFARVMTFDELGELASEGHEIGSHSMTHCLMPECDDATLDFELTHSRRRLHERLGVAAHSFCYPNGDADARCARAVAKAGYRRAVTTSSGCNLQDSDPFLLFRTDIDVRRILDGAGRILPAVLAWRMSGLYRTVN